MELSPPKALVRRNGQEKENDFLLCINLKFFKKGVIIILEYKIPIFIKLKPGRRET